MTGDRVTAEWLRGYLQAHGGRVDHFQVLQAAYDVDPTLFDYRRRGPGVLRQLIRELGGYNGPSGRGGRWVFDLRPLPSRRPERPERWAA